MINQIISKIKTSFFSQKPPLIDFTNLRKQAISDPLACAISCIEDRLFECNKDIILNVAWEYAARDEAEMAEKLICISENSSELDSQTALLIAAIYYESGNTEKFDEYIQQVSRLLHDEYIDDLDFQTYRLASNYLTKSRIPVFIQLIKTIQKLGGNGEYILKYFLDFDVTKYRNDILAILDAAIKVNNDREDKSSNNNRTIVKFFAKLTERKSVDEIVSQMTTQYSQIEIYEEVVEFMIKNTMLDEGQYYLDKMVILAEILSNEEEKLQWMMKLNTLFKKFGKKSISNDYHIDKPDIFSENYFEYLLATNRIDDGVNYFSNREELQDKLSYWMKICKQISISNSMDQYPAYLEYIGDLLKQYPDEKLEIKIKYLEEFIIIAVKSGNEDLSISVLENYLKIIHNPDANVYFDFDQIEDLIKKILDAGASKLAERVMAERDVVYKTWSKKKQMMIEKTDLLPFAELYKTEFNINDYTVLISLIKNSKATYPTFYSKVTYIKQLPDDFEFFYGINNTRIYLTRQNAYNELSYLQKFEQVILNNKIFEDYQYIDVRIPDQIIVRERRKIS